MTTIIITTMAGVKIEDNLLLLTFGDYNPSIIPLNQIYFISSPEMESEVLTLRDPIRATHFNIIINNKIKIQTKPHIGFDEFREGQSLINQIHDKLQSAMREFHKDKHTIYKPKPYKLQ